MINSAYNPTNIRDFEKTKLNFNAQGVSAAISGITTTNIDLVLTDDHLMTGAWFITNGSFLGDTISFQVLDTTGAFTGTAGTVLNTFITGWFPDINSNMQLDMAYPAKLLAGMTLRVVYHSTDASQTTFVAINYKLHKILV